MAAAVTMYCSGCGKAVTFAALLALAPCACGATGWQSWHPGPGAPAQPFGIKRVTITNNVVEEAK